MDSSCSFLNFDVHNIIAGKNIISNSTGAVSCLDDFDFLLHGLLVRFGEKDTYGIAEKLTWDTKTLDTLIEKLKKEGWARETRPACYGGVLDGVYIVVSEACNFSCSYCYQKPSRSNHNAGNGQYMPLSIFNEIVAKIQRFNPKARIILSGGEPLLHRNFIDIIQEVDRKELAFQLLTNGSLLNGKTLRALRACASLESVQISLDGSTKQIHGQTRGESTYGPVIDAIKALAEHAIPFTIAPTLHDGNIHDAINVANIAVSHGGGFTPNSYRKINEEDTLSMDYDVMVDELLEIENSFPPESAGILFRQNSRSFLKPPCNRDLFCCGTGRSLLNIDHRGNVFPCHLLHDDHFFLGNILHEDLHHILSNPILSEIRIESSEISECANCTYLSLCGGGCKAAVYRKHKRFDRPDPECAAIKRSFDMHFTKYHG